MDNWFGDVLFLVLWNSVRFCKYLVECYSKFHQYWVFFVGDESDYALSLIAHCGSIASHSMFIGQMCLRIYPFLLYYILHVSIILQVFCSGPLDVRSIWRNIPSLTSNIIVFSFHFLLLHFLVIVAMNLSILLIF